MASQYQEWPKPDICALEFFLRHIDDEPTILDYRFVQKVTRGVAETAMAFALIGEIDGATKLLEILRSFDIDPFTAADSPFLKPCMYFAWEASSSWPSWIPEEERSEKSLEKLEDEGRAPWLERFSEDWEVSEETAQKALKMAYKSIDATLPDYNGTLAGQVAQGEFSYAANPNGPMNVRYSKIAMWWRQGIYPYPYVQVHRTAGLMIALDIYLRLGQIEEPQGTFQRICESIHNEEQVEQLVCSRMAWKQILAVPERPILDMLKIHPAKLRSAVHRALEMTEQRLAQGPRRRYRELDIQKLVHVISANTVNNCPDGVLACYRPPDNPRPKPESEDGLLRAPCSPSEIANLEERLETRLPEDYKEFLRATNGLGSIWDGQNVVDYLAGAEEVCWEDIDYLDQNELALLRDGEPLPRNGNRLDWPLIDGTFRCICLSGPQNSEDKRGELFLLGPEVIQKSKDYFFKTYAERNAEQQQELDRIVEETYGSMEGFRDMEHALISWTGWDFTIIPYNGIRDLLERLAEGALYKDRPWLNIFEPRFRKLQ